MFRVHVYRDQDWDLKDIQHHLVRTQRMQTAKNKKFVADIARIDNDIEDLMKQVSSDFFVSAVRMCSPRFFVRSQCIV